jgi:DNA helicase-2/ATP-dependent DNA helicase PcrA
VSTPAPTDGLTEAQRAAVEHVEGPLLVVAGPGSGKTRVITHRIARLIEHGVHPGSILAITFTNKAAQEMVRRVESHGAAPGAWVKTFHATCAALLRRWPESAGLQHGFSIFDQQDQSRILRQILKRRELEDSGLKPAAARARISKWKTGGDTPEVAIADAANYSEQKAALIYQAYEEELAQSNAVDFDDLLVKARRMLDDDEAVRHRLQQRFEFVLIDEYQDTSPVQFHLARLLAEPQGNICATGDPDQSIYAFRNADLRNILEFEKHYPGATVVRLEENFRSVGNVLKAADGLIAHNKERHAKQLITTREEGQLLHVVGAANEHEEGLAIADAIMDGYSKGTPYRDVAVFYRVNAQSRAIEAGLRARGVPYMIVKGVEFYQRAEVKDLLAYLKVLANPSDRESMTRVLTTPKRGVGAKSLMKLFDACRSRGWTARQSLTAMADAQELPKKATLALRDVANLLERLERGAVGSVAELLRDTIASLHYEDHLKQAYPEDHVDRVENVRELVGGAEEYDIRAGESASLPDFLHEVGLVSDSDKYDPDMPRVALMTLHSAKGLEFPQVFIAGIEDGLLPHSRSAENAKAIEEERRLLFVGITRAKDRLTLTYARERRARLAGSFTGGASPFLLEIPQESMDVDQHELMVQSDPFGAGGQGGWGGQSDWSSGESGGWGGRRRSPRSAPSFGARSTGSSSVGFGGFSGGSAGASASGADTDEGVDPVVDYDGIDADPNEVASEATLCRGAKVRHSVFGEGTVRRLDGHGARARVTVFFRSKGEKTLALSHAKLELL